MKFLKHFFKRKPFQIRYSMKNELTRAIIVRTSTHPQQFVTNFRAKCKVSRFVWAGLGLPVSAIQNSMIELKKLVGVIENGGGVANALHTTNKDNFTIICHLEDSFS